MNIVDLKFVPQGTPDLNIQAFDCGRKSVNKFFREEAQDYQDELFGKTYYWVHRRCNTDMAKQGQTACGMAQEAVFNRFSPLRVSKKTLPLHAALATSVKKW